MTNCWSFIISATKCAKWSLSHTSGIAWLLHLTALLHSAHTTCKMVEFLDQEMPNFMPSCCLVLTQWTLFINEQDKVHHQSRVATDSTSWNKQACTHDTLPVETSTHYDVSITSRLAMYIQLRGTFCWNILN